MLFVRTTPISYKGRQEKGMVIYKDPRGNIRTFLKDVTVKDAKEICPLLQIYDFSSKRHISVVLDEIYEKYDCARDL